MIKNLLFDLGGVILDIDRMKAVEALREAGMRDPEELLGDYGQKGPFLALEKGEISPEEFRAELRTHFDRPVDDETIDASFCEFLRGIPPHRLKALEQLHRRFKIYLLSNTNALMWDRYIVPEFTKSGHDINYYFDGLIASFRVKAYKPDAAIFKAAEELLGIDPEENLFFDDSQANVEAARRLGFHAALVTPEADFIELISKKLPQ